MHDLRTALLALQELDDQIIVARAKLAEFEPQLASLEQPITTLLQEIENTRARLADLRQQAKKLERGAEQKRERLRAYEDRLARVRTTREESAARTEIDLVRRATEADETEALEMMEQATRTDLKVDELERNLEKLKNGIAPQRDQLLQARSEAEAAVQQLTDKRENQAVRLDPGSLKLYERVRSGRAKRVLAPMTGEGACGNCFNILPIQEQAEVRGGRSLRRCEGCGVILYPE